MRVKKQSAKTARAKRLKKKQMTGKEVEQKTLEPEKTSVINETAKEKTIEGSVAVQKNRKNTIGILKRKQVTEDDPVLTKKKKPTVINEISNANKNKETGMQLDQRQLNITDSSSAVITQLPTKFELAIREGPTIVCSCCLRLWFPLSCRKLNRQNLVLKYGNEFVKKIYNDGDQFCASCSMYIYKGHFPRYWSGNYSVVYPVPEELKDLTTLEERMVSARIPFMQIREVGYARQCYITGQIVNVPVNVDTTTRILPRNLDDTQTIQVQLKKKLNFKNAYLLETIRPAVVIKAAEYLCQQPLYVQEGIQVSNNWQKDIENYISSQQNHNDDDDDILIDALIRQIDLESFNYSITKQINNIAVDELNNCETMEVEKSNNAVRCNKKEANIYQLDEFLEDEDEEPLNPGGQETLLNKNNLENICFAPGEGKTPIHLMQDKYSDELSFPSLYCGKMKQFFVKYSYSDEIKIQLQHKDRRFARTDYLLYTFKKSQIILLTKAVYTCLRKKKNESGKYTAGQVRQPDFIEQLVKNDDGYHFLNKIKGSPAYWKQEKTKLMCMIRQFGIPTLFITISAAETAWPELIVILAKVIDGKEISLEEANTLSYLEKTRLIRTDPITCARYFDHRFKLLFKHMKSDSGPFKQHPIVHFYYRVEFQHRGSPHIHGLLWLADAPKFDETAESFKECCQFADKFITCQGDLESVSEIIQFNTHHHSKSCKKDIKGYEVCRYGIPYLPMDETTILMPIKLDKKIDTNKELRKTMSEKLLLIKTKLQNKPDLSFEEFLADLCMSKEEYLTIIQHNIFKTTMFLKRRPKDCFINNFNEEIFTMMRSNMDIQLVYEPYGCCSYIVNYINKSQRGVSDLLMRTMEAVKKGNLDIKGKLKAMASVFLNASEVSAQEAAYCVLQIPLHETSSGYIYIPTNPIMERTKLLKSLAELKEMSAEDTNIYCDGLIEHYEQRPDELENICLAELAAYYQFSKKEEQSKKATIFPLKDGSGILVKRSHPKIISYRRYGLQQDPINYYREQIMLYVSWRNEVDEVENVDQQIKYVDRYAEIVENRRKFNVLDEKILDDALQCAQDRTDDLINNGFEGNIDNEYMAYAIDNPDYNPFDGIDGNQNEAPVKHMAFPTPHQIPDSEYEELISKLNQKQYEFLNIVQDQLLEKQPFYCVLSGPAGTGKSHLITAITQTLLRHYNSIPGNNPEGIKVLLAAPTGKAAFNIGGITLHSALSLPVNQYDDDLIPLSHETVNTIYSALCELKLIIIDEYSMVGAKMFGHVNSRLQQIFKSDEAFGNIPIVMCGDSRQLPPVGDSFLFLPSKRNPYKEICGTYLWDLFKYFELTEIMRQSNDKSFAIALNNMACGAMTDDDVKLIKSREVPTDFQIPEDTIHLFSYNSDVDAYNNEKLSTYNTERSVSEAKDVVKGSCSEKLKTLFLEYAKGLKKSESFGLMLTVTLQLNAKYMISLNIDTKDGLVNGATGALRKIEYDHNQIPNRVWIEFFDTKTGIDCRNKHKAHMEAHNIPTTWTPILKTARAIKIQKGSNVHVERLQFPLLISEGITIHKSQGATYEQVVVHIRKQMSRSSVYVACSRVTKLSGLYIIGQFKAPRPPTDKDVAFKELKNLQTNKLLISRYENQFVKDVHVKNVIAYQNVQSLSKNLKFIKNNPIFKDAHLLFFVETWLHKNSTTNIEINGFECFANLFSNENVSKPFGIICYKKKDLTAKISSINKYTKNFSGIVFQAVTFLLNDIFVIIVYNPPKLTILQAQRCLSDIIFGQQGRILIIGDFNQDIINETQNGLKMTLNFKGLTSKLSVDESTTKSNTQIDWLFSNFKNLQHFIYNTVYSHHKAIVVSIYDKDFIPTLPKTVNESKKVSQKLHFNVKNTNNNNQYLATQASLQEDEESINNDDDIILSSDDESIPPNVYSTPPSLMNRDNVSCYANSVLQSLLCLPEIRNSISKRNTNINSRIHDIMLKRTNSAMAVRQLLGGIFLQQEQQDAEEFCRKLLRKLDVDDVQIYINARAHLDVKHCENCNINEYGTNDMVSIYIAYFPENCGNNINFELMFIPRQSELICQNCSNHLTTFSKLTFVSKYLVLQLQRSQIINGRSVKINTTFSNFNNQNVVLDNFRFKVKCVIKHHGQEITSGHYTSVVNINNQWWNCDDNNIGKVSNFDDTLKDVYLMILELITN